MIKDIERDNYILANYKEYTCAEMARHLKIENLNHFYTICTRLGVKPISMKEKTIKFVERNLQLSFNEMAKALGISVHSLDGHFRKFSWPTISIRDRDKPLIELIGGIDLWPKEFKKEKNIKLHKEVAMVYNHLTAKYQNNITLEDIAGSNNGPSWSSF